MRVREEQRAVAVSVERERRKRRERGGKPPPTAGKHLNLSHLILPHQSVPNVVSKREEKETREGGRAGT